MPPFLLDLLDPATAEGWLEVVKSLGLGLTVSALVFIWALFKGHVVWGWQYQAKERTEQEWRNAALSGTGVLEKFVERVERIETRRL